VSGSSAIWRQRLWQTGTAAQGAEAPLELAAGESRVVGRGRAQRLGSAAAVVALQHVSDGTLVVELVAEGLAEGVVEVAPRSGGREVEEGPGEGGDRDASERGGISGIEGACAVQADPRGACFRRGRGHVRLRRVVGEQAPVDRRARVAQDGASAASQHRGEVSSLAGQCRAADRVDAAVDPPQAAGLRAQLHRARPKPERLQLRQRHDAPLAMSELGERLIDARAVFAKHVIA
jgi:hypothetical protein